MIFRRENFVLCYRFCFWQGLCEQTLKVLQLMEAGGIEPNIIMLNVLINAFGIAGRHMEALSIYDQMTENVSHLLCITCIWLGTRLFYFVDSCIFLVHFILQDIICFYAV